MFETLCHITKLCSITNALINMTSGEPQCRSRSSRSIKTLKSVDSECSCENCTAMAESLKKSKSRAKPKSKSCSPRRSRSGINSLDMRGQVFSEKMWITLLYPARTLWFTIEMAGNILNLAFGLLYFWIGWAFGINMEEVARLVKSVVIILSIDKEVEEAVLKMSWVFAFFLMFYGLFLLYLVSQTVANLIKSSRIVRTIILKEKA